jgi:glutamate synthase (NADPH/NADH) small chain
MAVALAWDGAASISADDLVAEFDAVVLAGGSETPRDLPIPGRELDGVHFALDFLPQQNHVNAGDKVRQQIHASGKHVVVIGGGDTGSDCIGTSNRQGAQSVANFELFPMPPEHENKPLIWPYWPLKLRTSSSHEEGCLRDWAIGTKRFNDDGHGKVKSLTASRLKLEHGRMVEIPGTDFDVPAELILLAMGFVSPRQSMLEAFNVERTPRGTVKATDDIINGYRTNVDKIFAAGDMRRGQSLVVWGIREGRQCARAVDEYLMGYSELPR